MTQPQMNFDISKTTPLLTPSGGKIWHSGFVLRKASRFLTGGDSDAVIPLQVFYDPETMEINMEGIPETMKFMFEDEKPNLK